MIKVDLEYQVAFGQHLRKLRKDRNWGLVDLAERSNVDQTNISKIELGDISPNLHTILALALALGKHPAELFDFEYNLEYNTDFSVRENRQQRTNTTETIKKLVNDNFFATPQSVAAVVNACKTNYNVELPSDDTSGVLLKLVRDNVLIKVPGPKKGRNLYQNK